MPPLPRLLLATLLLTLLAPPARALDQVIELSAIATTQPAKITLKWPSANSLNLTNESHTIYRKSLTAQEWGEPLAKLDGKAITYEDAGVKPGQIYEYQVVRDAAFGDKTPLRALGFTSSGIEVPAVEDRGIVILLVDAQHADALKEPLQTLESDLVGDGWTVLRHDIPRTMKDTEIKALIKKDVAANPEHVRALFILGHVPVPYSGNILPDGHTDHKGAYPADMYYGDLTGTWTDKTVDTTPNGQLRSPSNTNLPGDGKWDQDLLPEDGKIVLDIGRVDLHALPTIQVAGKETDETGLLKNYLNKNHRYRHNLPPFDKVRRRALFDNSYILEPRAYTAAAGTPESLLGPDALDVADWVETLPTLSYTWAFGLKGGDYYRINGIITTPQLSTRDMKCVFTMLFGSWSGDWDAPHNLLRAVLAAGDHTLTSCWGAPKWYFHPMAMGDTIGACARLTQNNHGLYPAPGNRGRLLQTQSMIHIALMGDPTLRLFPVTPPSGLLIQRNADNVHMLWQPSPDKVAGYNVYRSDKPGAPYKKVSTELLTQPNFIDKSPAGPEATYMIRALKLETSGSGTYYNLSQGLFGKHY